MTDHCTLCDLSTSDPPVTADDVDGSFCCRGCLAVARTLDDAASADADRVRAALGGSGPTDSADAVGADTVAPDDAADSFLAVDGMHCATCEAFVESRVRRDDRVYAADASYASGLVKVTHDPSFDDVSSLADRIDGLGYRARAVDDEPRAEEHSGRLLVGGFFGMMTMLWYVLFLYPAYLGADDSLLLFDISSSAGAYLLANVWVMTTVVLLYTGFPILRGAYVSLRAGQPNMDLLVATAATTAYVYSTALALTGATEVYFDITVVVVLAVSLGGYYEERLREKAAGSVASLSERRVSEARVRRDGGVETVALDRVAGGDRVIVRAGETIPVDGCVVDGSAAVDESLVTGESTPARRGPGEKVVGGARVCDGGLVVVADAEATRTMDRLVEMQWDLRTRSGAQRLADRLARVFVPLVFALALAAGVAHVLFGATPTAALLTALTVLVVSCPCALGLATPMAVASGVRAALGRGIVVRSGELFERGQRRQTIAFDKTGTLTTGRMTVVDVVGDDETLAVAAALERFADHPVADAIVDAADTGASAGTASLTMTDGGRFAGVSSVETSPGRGVSGTVDGHEALVGSAGLFAARDWAVPMALRERAERARETGTVPALVGWDGAARGVVVAGDEPRPEWQSVADALSADHRIVVVTGDSEAAAASFEAHGAVDEVFADVRPEAKAALVDRLQRDGPVVFVGDGSNDAPALAAADLGVALESGTPLAVEAADVVITTDDLRTLETVFTVTRATRRRLRQNLGWAFCYNLVAIPLAVFGLLNPLFAAVAMTTSSLLVVLNSQRSLVGDSGTLTDEPNGTRDERVGGADS